MLQVQQKKFDEESIRPTKNKYIYHNKSRI